MKIIITSPSLNVNTNVSGVSAVSNFIINLNTGHQYIHFEIGKKDAARRDWNWFRRLLKMYYKWTKLMLTTRHLIHFNFPVDKRSIIRDVPLIVIAKILRKRMVVHLHGGEFLLAEDVPPTLKFMIRLAIAGKHPIICLSPTEKLFVTKRFKSRNAIELPNAIDLTDARKFNRAYADDKPLSILFLGRIHADKGIEYIYRAFELLKQNGVKFKFVMAGKGPLEEEYNQKFRALLGADYEFKGIVSGAHKTEALQQCDIFLLPSFWEGLPIALLEGMSFALTPVTSDVGAMKTVVVKDTTGMVVKSRSAQDIADAITALDADREKMKMLAKNARELVFMAYNPDKYIDTLNIIYQNE